MADSKSLDTRMPVKSSKTVKVRTSVIIGILVPFVFEPETHDELCHEICVVRCVAMAAVDHDNQPRFKP